MSGAVPVDGRCCRSAGCSISFVLVLAGRAREKEWPAQGEEQAQEDSIGRRSAFMAFVLLASAAALAVSS